jgi:hypothetical protein
VKAPKFLAPFGFVLLIIGAFLLLDVVATPFLIGPDCNPCQTLYGSWELVLIVDNSLLVPSIIFIVIGVLALAIGNHFSLDTRSERDEKFDNVRQL